jgi:hypothetical protein
VTYSASVSEDVFSDTPLVEFGFSRLKRTEHQYSGWYCQCDYELLRVDF